MANIGNVTATNVVVTNSLSGLSIVTFTNNSGVGNITVNGGLLQAGDVAFNISELAVSEQREITVTADLISCTPLAVDIAARLDCFGTTCSQKQGGVSFNTPDPYLLTNNGQSADLPMCDLGFLTFTTKVVTSQNIITWDVGDIAVGDTIDFFITGTVAIHQHTGL